MLENPGKHEREVGRVVYVSNYRVTVQLDADIRSQVRAYPYNVTFVTQIGGYLLFEVAPGEHAVGIVVGASEDETLDVHGDQVMTLQLVRSRRVLRLNLLGQLIEGKPFIPGISVYPTLDTAALLPSEDQLKRILEFTPPPWELSKDTSLSLGTSPIYRRQYVTASFNDLFARPLGVIGNTGSGKSFTVASLIQKALAASPACTNAKIIILDINGEYETAFPPKDKHSQPDLNTVCVNGQRFVLPLWAFNLNELVKFFDASEASQVPVLERVTTLLRERTLDKESTNKLRTVLHTADHCRDLLQSLAAFAATTDGMAVCDGAAEICAHLLQYNDQLAADATGVIVLSEQFKEFKTKINGLSGSGLKSRAEYKKMRNARDYEGFNRMDPVLATAVQGLVAEFEPVFEEIRSAVIMTGGLKEITADSPIPFAAKELDRDGLYRLAVGRFRAQDRILEYISTLRLRIHRQLSDKRWSIFTEETSSELTSLLSAIVGDQPVTVIDCSSLSFDVLPFFCAIIGRLLLELRTRIAREKRLVQPYLLVLEEAHNYLRPYRENEATGVKLSREAFERIAKEGRKFGLSLVIASQRPSDVSATVLSQCANFVVHRIQNPEDIDYFKMILPSGSRDLLDQLPILAPGDGLLLGSAVNVPARIKVSPPKPPPSSETPKPWHAWHQGDKFDLKAAADSWVRESGGSH